MREKRGSIEFLIHWKGFPREENEWKKETELENAKDSIRDFYRRHPTASRLNKTIQLRSSEYDSPCICPICTKQPFPIATKGSILLSSDFL